MERNSSAIACFVCESCLHDLHNKSMAMSGMPVYELKKLRSSKEAP